MAAAAAALLLPRPPRSDVCSPKLPTKPLTTTTTTTTTRSSPTCTFSSSHRFSRVAVAFSYRSSSSNGTPDTECPVPLEQQPVNEYQSLSSSLPFSWATAALPYYFSRLAFVGSTFAILVGLPVASFRASADADVLQCAVAAASSGLLAVTLAVLRMYLGWAYVGNRLLSATVEYEETGWYDGQIWVKTPEVLARDRLLGSFTVKPVLNRVKLTLVGLAVSLAACGLLYVNVDSPKSTLPEGDGGRAVAGVYSEESARSFEPDAFCGPSQSEK